MASLFYIAPQLEKRMRYCELEWVKVGGMSSLYLMIYNVTSLHFTSHLTQPDDRRATEK